MQVLGVIPARYGSTRLPAKPLLKINGRPLLEWVVNGVRSAQGLNELIVATDHQDIANLAEKIGVRAVMTDPQLPSGSDRVWAAARERSCDVVLNIQGDEPLIQPFWIDRLIKIFSENSDAKMATLAHRLAPEELESRGVVKLIMNRRNEAIYFSRFAIPYSRESIEKYPGLALKHIGLYGYRREFLKTFCEQPATPLERAESLEQLRAMWLGERIHVATIDAVSVGVDTADDVRLVESLTAKRGV